MQAYKFSVGDRVRLNLQRYVESSPSDVHTVSRRMPAEANVWQYRVKRVGDGQERTVTEDQLVAMGAEARRVAAHDQAVGAQELRPLRNGGARLRAERSRG